MAFDNYAPGTEMTFDEWYDGKGLPRNIGKFDLLRHAFDEATKIEREACAKICDCYALDDAWACDDARRCARAIRRRSDK